MSETSPGNMLSNSEVIGQNLVGYLRRSREDNDPLSLEIDQENYPFFILNAKTGLFEVNRQGSKAIVELLESNLLNQQLNPVAFSNLMPFERHLAFFDYDGQFHNFAFLMDLRKDWRGDDNSIRRDTAVFAVFDHSSEKYDELVIAVDDIFCLSGIQHPIIEEQTGYN